MSALMRPSVRRCLFRQFSKVSIVVIFIALGLATSLLHAEATTLSATLKKSSLKVLGFYKNINLCLNTNQLRTRWHAVGASKIIGRKNLKVANFLCNFGYAVRTSGMRSEGAYDWRPTASFLKQATVNQELFGSSYCIPVAKREFSKVTYTNEWSANLGLGPQKLLSYTFEYKIRILLGEGAVVGPYKGKIVMTLDPTDGIWKVMTDKCGLSDNGVQVFYKYVNSLELPLPKSAKTEQKSFNSPSTDKKEGATGLSLGFVPTLSKKSSLQELAGQYYEGQEFKQHDIDVNADFETTWDEVLDYLGGSFFISPWGIAIADKESGYILTKIKQDPSPDRLGPSSNVDRYRSWFVVKVKLLSSSTVQLSAIRGVYDSYDGQSWSSYSNVSYAERLCKSFLKKVKKKAERAFKKKR